MANKNFQDYNLFEFITSFISFILLVIITILQYLKNRPFWWILVMVSILMAGNSYLKYKKIKNKK